MTFELKVYSRRDHRYMYYRIEKIENGWDIKYLQTRFDTSVCDKTGAPNLYKQLNQDSINYPKDLGNYMEYLWDQATEEDMTDTEIQDHLNELGAWISTVEKESPKGTLWEGYN
ncbi:hypothetical protein [Methanosarcina soligelidi]|uniref:hypothetical protein n=1 Tax=Methanosarcina soligelidi TaxID=1036677 RepID=UPI0012687E99|nr:hypothetical protein [Methanosarcina soligelidi]